MNKPAMARRHVERTQLSGNSSTSVGVQENKKTAGAWVSIAQKRKDRGSRPLEKGQKRKKNK